MRQKLELDYGQSCGVKLHFIKDLYGDKMDGHYLIFDWDEMDVVLFFTEEKWLKEIADLIYENISSVEKVINDE